MTRLRGAIIGYGFIASRGHMPAFGRLEHMLSIVAVADPCAALREAARRDIPGVAVYENANELMRANPHPLDFVDIATPPAFHYSLIVAAIENGLHVICEKPLVLSKEQADDVVRRALAAKRVVMPCHNYRFAPVIKAISEVIGSGRIGAVNGLTLTTFRNTHAKGVPEWMPNWRRKRAFAGGGIAMDHGCHSLYVAFDWLRAYPQSVTAKAVCLRQDLGDVEDNLSASVSFPTGMANIHLTWTAGIRKVIYTVHGELGAIKAEDDDVEVSVQRPTDAPDVAQGAVEWVSERMNTKSNWMDASHSTWFDSVFARFADAIRAGDLISRELLDAYMCVAIIEAAYRSAANASREVAVELSPQLEVLRAQRPPGA